MLSPTYHMEVSTLLCWVGTDAAKLRRMCRRMPWPRPPEVYEVV